MTNEFWRKIAPLHDPARRKSLENIPKQARSIVRGIIKDFTDRGGLQNEWEQIDYQIQAEIIIRWREIVKDILKEV